MFYVAELNLKGKGPLGRMWHACHNPKKISKKIADDFDYDEGFQAIVDPADQRVWALRLNGQLLLGYVQLHSAKVRYFQDRIKQAHERLTLSFRNCTASIDMKTPAKPKKIESITLSSSTITDPLLSLDIPDEIPEWLRSSEEMSHSDLLTQSSVPSSSPRASLHSFRGSDINLQDRRSELSASLDDDLLDAMLMPSIEDDAKNPLDVDFQSYEGGITEDGPSSAAAGDSHRHSGEGAGAEDELANYGAGEENQEMEIQYGADALSPDGKPEKTSPTTVVKKKRATGKRKRLTILNETTQLSKEEMRLWVGDQQWAATHLCRPPNPYQRERGFADLPKGIGLPLVGGLGKRLRAFLLKSAVPPKVEMRKRQRRAKNGEDEDGQPQAGLADDDVGYVEQQDAGDIDFDLGAGGSSSGGIADSFNNYEDPEQLRAASEDGRFSHPASRQSRQRSESLDGEFPFGFEQSPMERASINSRLTSLGGLGDADDGPGFTLEPESDGTPFKDASLREEPESYQGTSQLPMSQRLSEHHVTIARQIAQRLPDEDSTLSFNHISKKGDFRQAAKLFYSMLVLMNENIVDLDQSKAYGDIIIRATANTAMYAFA